MRDLFADTVDVLSRTRKEVSSPAAMDLISDFEFGFPTTLDFVNPPPEWSHVNPLYYELNAASPQQKTQQQQPLTPSHGLIEDAQDAGLAPLTANFDDIPVDDLVHDDIADLDNYLFAGPSTSTASLAATTEEVRAGNSKEGRAPGESAGAGYGGWQHDARLHNFAQRRT